jgi:hypothetical protein
MNCIALGLLFYTRGDFYDQVSIGFLYDWVDTYYIHD